MSGITPSVNVIHANSTELNKSARDESLISNQGNAESKTTAVTDINKIHDSITEPPISTKQLESVAQQLQDFVGEMNRGLQFSVDKNSGRDVIKVIDKESGDLIKQYPSEEVLSLVAKLSKAAGSLIDEKV